MNKISFWIYLFILAGSTYLIRAVPFAAIRKKIQNRFIQSFLYYIPYSVLAAMTIPAIFYVTGHPLSAFFGLAVAAGLALCKKSLTVVAASACAVVFLVELFL